VRLGIGPAGLTSGSKDVRVHAGSQVVLQVTSTLPGEMTLLVHGYDVRSELDAADGAAQVSFRANRRGDFPLIVEETGAQVAVLHVS
jgi:FtsP/CotA-like multicopper oxidase with cupredoxin domain